MSQTAFKLLLRLFKPWMSIAYIRNNFIVIHQRLIADQFELISNMTATHCWSWPESTKPTYKLTSGRNTNIKASNIRGLIQHAYMRLFCIIAFLCAICFPTSRHSVQGALLLVPGQWLPLDVCKHQAALGAWFRTHTCNCVLCILLLDALLISSSQDLPLDVEWTPGCLVRPLDTQARVGSLQEWRSKASKQTCTGWLFTHFLIVNYL